MENFKKITKQQSPARTIAFGFAVLIFIGAALLSLPIAVRGAGSCRGWTLCLPPPALSA